MKALILFLLLPACSLRTKIPAEPTTTQIDRAKAVEESTKDFQNVLEVITEKYYTEIDPQLLTYWAVQGMVEHLNDHGGFSWDNFRFNCNSSTKDLQLKRKLS